MNGSKTFITNAGQAAWIVVFAKTDPAADHRGISAFVVPMDTKGVTIEKHLDKMGQRATDTSAFSFSDVVVPAANRLGGEGDGFKIAMQTLDTTRPGTAIGAVGVAQAAYEHAAEYSKERVTFGQPIAMNQGINFLIADMVTNIEAARLLCWQAAWMLDAGYGRKATLYSSMAKRFAADIAMEVTTDAVQIFGGYGYIKEYPVEKLMRDAKLYQIYEGTSQIQRLVIARDVLMPRRLTASDGARDRPLRGASLSSPAAPAALGRQDALVLAQAGADVVIADIQVESDESEDAAEYGALAQVAKAQGLVYSEQTAQEIQELGRRSAAIKCDVTDSDRSRRPLRGWSRRWARSTSSSTTRPRSTTWGSSGNQVPELWERDLRVNLTGAFNCSRAVWPHMVERGWGRIVNMASVAGTLGGFGQASYSTTKAGLIGLTKTLALEGARHGITANAIVPGIIGTEAFNFGNPEMNERMVKRTALRRPGEPSTSRTRSRSSAPTSPRTSPASS